MSKFYWDDLLENLAQRRKVVPVIGIEVLAAAHTDHPLSFHRALALRTAENLGTAGVEDLSANTEFAEFLESGLGRVRHRAEFTRALSAAHRELLATAKLPEPLRLLAEITDFPLILTTGIDGLLGRALGISEDAALVSTLSSNADLAPDWEPAARGSRPTLIHLFGRIAATPGYALTEEDTLEFMWSLQGERRPSRLLSRIRRSDVLLIGNRFSDWLARFFLRLLRGERLSLESETFEAVADSEAQEARPLVTFLQRFSPQTRIYTEGTAADFVRDLHRRWRALQPQAGPQLTSATDADSHEPEEMRAGAIFLSYASEDLDAAQTLAAALDRVGLDVWFDKNRLRGGDRYAAKIRQHIQRCDLFVPLLSRNSESRQDGFFRREWTWARERLPSIGPARPFMLPLVIDDLDAYSSPDLAHYFEMPGREVHVLRVPRGRPDESHLDDFIRAIRQVRAARPVAVSA